MSLPQAVRDAEERANAIIETIKGGSPALGVTPAQEPAVTPNPAPTIDSGAGQPAGAQDDGSFEHRFKVLQGKYNAEVPRLMAAASRADSLSTKVEELSRLNAQLLEQLKAAAPAPQSLVTKDEIEEHGEGLVDVIRRAAREELASRDSKILELEQRLASVGEGVANASKRGFLDVLTEQVPDWPSVNDDPTFHRWLLERDALSGRTRQALLTEAQGQGDGERAANIFKAFAKTRDSWAANADASLSQHIAPPQGGAGGPPPANPNQGRVFARSEITDFYSKVRTGQVKGAEAAAIEAEIQRAMVEGRVR